jgi:hypothetical protein
MKEKILAAILVELKRQQVHQGLGLDESFDPPDPREFGVYGYVDFVAMAKAIETALEVAG